MQYRGNVLLWPKSDESKKNMVLFYLFTLWLQLSTSLTSLRVLRHIKEWSASTAMLANYFFIAILEGEPRRFEPRPHLEAIRQK